MVAVAALIPLGLVTPPASADAQVVATWPVGQNPMAVAVSPDGARIYVANRADDTVQVLANDGSTLTTVAGFSDPNSIALNPDGSRLAVVNQTANSLSIVDTDSWTTTSTSVGTTPLGVSITSDGATAYVGSYIDRTVIPVDLATATGGTAIDISIAAGYSALTPDDSTLYVTDAAGTTSMAVVSTSGPSSSLASLGRSRSVAISPDGRTGYIAANGSGEVTVFATATNSVLSTIPLSGEPNQVALTPDGALLLVTVSDGTLAIIDVRSLVNPTVTTVSVGSSPEGVATSPDGRFAYVTDWGADTVSVVRLPTPTGGSVPAPPDILQQVESGAEPCASFSDPALDWGGVATDGWSASWASWARAGSGGPVCTRTLGYQASTGRWMVR